MRFGLWAGTSAMVIGTAVAGAAPATAQQSDVNSYLCTFAGKCGAAAPVDEELTKDAPETKGFRVAPQMDKPAPLTRGFAFKPPTATAKPVARAPYARAVPSRRANGYAAARPVPAPASGVARANLMLAFDYNSAQMTPAAEARAKTFAEALMMDALKDKRFLIAGHTDARGKRDINIDLSRKRAQSVADFLIAQGVDRSRVVVKGVGPDEPLPGQSPKAEANRRVEAVLLS